jgi:hypothetical protein
MRAAAAVLLLALAGSVAAQVYPVDYSVYFWPDPSTAPEKRITSRATIERRFAIVYNVGQGPGTHSYKLLLRAFAPDGAVVCETTTMVAPWTGKHTMKKVAWFEAAYPAAPAVRKVRPGKYLLRAYLTEQTPAGEPAQDAEVANNQYPFEPPQYMPVEFEVRPGAGEIRCALPPTLPVPEPLPRK